MNYLVIADIDTNKVLNRIETDRVNNIAVFSGEKINTIGVWFGCHCDNHKIYYGAI